MPIVGLQRILAKFFLPFGDRSTGLFFRFVKTDVDMRRAFVVQSEILFGLIVKRVESSSGI